MIFYKGFNYNPAEIISKRDLKEGGRVQSFIDNECIRLMDPYTPKDIGNLIKSATINTTPGTGRIVQITPYAKRWYYTPAIFQGAPMRGNKWFERMKASHRDSILRGAASLAGAKSK